MDSAAASTSRTASAEPPQSKTGLTNRVQFALRQGPMESRKLSASDATAPPAAKTNEPAATTSAISQGLIGPRGQPVHPPVWAGNDPVMIANGSHAIKMSGQSHARRQSMNENAKLHM